MDNVVKSVNKLGTALTKPAIARDCVAGSTGLEPAASGVTGRRSNQLSYTPYGTRLAHRKGIKIPI